MTASKSIFSRLEPIVQAALAANPACHDWDHTLRVVRNAREIAAGEGIADLAVVECAALLHDIARGQEICPRGKANGCHAQQGAILARRILEEQLKCHDQAFVEAVVHAVAAHRYRRRHDGAAPETLEAKIVYDADKLDSLGAIGVGRAFHFAGRIGARVHNAAEEALAAEEYSSQDSAWREYLVKLRHLPAAMLTATGRRLARQRHRRMAGFFKALAEETGLA